MNGLAIRSLASFLASSLEPSIERADLRVLAHLGNGQLVIDARLGACTHNDQLVPLPAAVDIWRRFSDRLDLYGGPAAEFSSAHLRLELRVQRTSDARQRTCSLELVGTAMVATVAGQVASAEAFYCGGYAPAPIPTALEQLRAQVLSL